MAAGARSAIAAKHRGPEPRRKAFARRSTAGCLICRQRRIRCDETKPRCNRCAVSGWTCQYSYADSSPPSTTGSSPATTIVQWHSDYGISSCERRAIHYFTHYLESDLWTYSVPRRCYSAQVVRSAVVALTSMHVDFTARSPSPRSNTSRSPPRGHATSLGLYGAAVSDLRAYIALSKAPSKAEVLLACAALACCDLLRGDAVQATQHVDNGAAVVRAWQLEAAGRSAAGHESDSMDAIVDAFCALDLHATTFVHDRVPLLGYYTGRDAEMAMEFSSSGQAQQALIRLLSAAFANLIEHEPYKFKDLSMVPTDLALSLRGIQDDLRTWWTAFEAYEAQRLRLGGATSRKERAMCNVMRVQHRTVELLIDETFPEDGSVYACEYSGNQVLQWAESALLDSSACEQQQTAHKAFSVDLGLSCCLFLLVIKTPSAGIRSRGMVLLSRVQGQEGWHRPEAMADTVRELTRLQGGGARINNSEGVAPHLQEMALEWVAATAGLNDTDIRQKAWLGSQTGFSDGLGSRAAALSSAVN
ncbi:hypothetical protein LTR53_004494 [Teratosphaeriaceae sp. CCFEE 6253]|nr:hypothetical protein LTR53_004494 [Teratosphaeriaceae sp. CCFEE 6253]